MSDDERLSDVTRPAPPRGQRILITGGTGFIGTALAERLAADNEVIAFDYRVNHSSWALRGHNGNHNGNGKSHSGNGNGQVILGDILDARAVARAVKGVDTIIHLAAIVGVNKVRAHPRETIETNFLGTMNLIRAAHQLPRLNRFVYFSTSEVFGGNSFRVQESMSTSVGPVQETRWSYSISKLVGEHLLQCYHREFGMPTVTIRPFNIFGPGRIGDHALLRFIVNALRNEEIIVHGSGDQIRSWCYIDDMVDAVISALVRPEAVGEDFNIGNPRNTLTIYDLARRVVQLLGSSSPIRLVELNYADIDLRVPRPEKAQRLLGFNPRVDMDEGIRRSAEWCAMCLPDVVAALETAPKPLCAPATAPRRRRRADQAVAPGLVVAPAGQVVSTDSVVASA